MEANALRGPGPSQTLPAPGCDAKSKYSHMVAHLAKIDVG